MILHACANSQEEIKLKAELAQPLAELQAAARAIAEVQRECKLEVDADVYVESFRPSLMDIIHAWSKVGAARNGSLKGSGGFQDRKSGVGGLPAQPDGHHPRLEQGAFCRPGPPHLKEERAWSVTAGCMGQTALVHLKFTAVLQPLGATLLRALPFAALLGSGWLF